MLADTDRKDKAIEVIGTEPHTAIKMQFDRLQQDGILVDLNISGTGMFQRTPDWTELGIPEFTGDKRTT